MNNLGVLLLLMLYGACDVLAGRRYIAIPVDGIDVLELNPISLSAPRIARQADPAYVPIAVPNLHHEELENSRAERSIGQILDYVDYGGHTGSNGAFGWYADYPAHR
ncbi:hypothetical protein HZH66_005141 [Vespula vulgaris]|uniref:Uncharacterized protein n=2 Tax=Vespula TaxID=7451 RepID=A0A834NCA6_VESVU|nr:uncharacterized protein LOC127063291 [Vespula vulgaris]KAF7402874.1 hypothetical protein HZH66_005141 [Vespula vulgaris]